VIAAAGVMVQRTALREAGTWPQLVVIWLSLTPLWAVATAWLSREAPAPVAPVASVASVAPVALVAPIAPLVIGPASEGASWRALFRTEPEPAAAAIRRPRLAELLRLAMCLVGIGFLAALAWSPSWTWIPLVGVTWGLGLAADLVERGPVEPWQRIASFARRGLSAVLVFQYVCLAWIFFRAASFDDALAVLRQIATLETDHANLVPIVTLALVVGFVCHLFADGSFAWLRRRFVALPPWAQGAVLAAVALVLRELGHAKVVPFIYFQF
jgi:hypothetical protein